ncbi:unnamed protein product, partial [marine sediment metagenome]
MIKMTRVKRGQVKRRKHKKVLKEARRANPAHG